MRSPGPPEMAEGRPRSLHRALALLGLVAFLMHAALKLRDGLLPELLWGCNLTAVALVLGFAFEWDAVVGVAFLWRLGLGEPGFITGLFSGERYAWTTAFVHLVPTALAWFYLRRSGLRRGSALWAFALSLALIPLGRLLTPPELNVNFGHARVAWLARLFPGTWSYRVALLLLLALPLAFGEWAGRRWWFRPRG